MTLYRRIWVLLCCGISLALLIAGAVQIWVQHQRVLSAAPAAATVVSTEIVTTIGRSKFGKFPMYEPVVHYEFAAQGRTWHGKNVFSTPAIGKNAPGRVWAGGIRARFPAGAKVTAYYHPADPSDSFLLPHLPFDPYLVVLAIVPTVFTVGMVSCFVILPSLRHGAVRYAAKAPRPLPTGGFQLQPRASIRGRMLRSLARTASWWAVGLLAAGHYFLFADRPYETSALVVTPIYGAVALVLAGLLLYDVLAWRGFAEPTVTADTDAFIVGEPFALLLEQQGCKPMIIEVVEITLTCTRAEDCGGPQPVFSISTYYEAKHTLLESQVLHPGTPISAMQLLTVPATSPATSPAAPVPNPYYDWSIEIRVKVPKRPDYHGSFPIVVEPATAC